MNRHFENKKTSKTSRYWDNSLAIAFPEGIIRHPSVIDRVEAEITRLGSFCNIDPQYPGISMSFSVEARNHHDARFRSNFVAGEILILLGLPPEAIAEHTISRTPMF